MARAATTAPLYTPILTLAEGGMGTVGLAAKLSESFSRLYAVKRLRPALSGEESFRTMFLDEARVAGLISHPNVVGVIDYGEDDQGPYLVMDYVRGVSVAELIGRTVSHRRQLPLQVCLRIAMEAAEGLHAAHELSDATGERLGVVHRDVSPQNLLLGRDGVCRVVDFGIAKAYGRLTRTDTGVLKGKLGYMSPEQLRFHEPDPRSDIFCLGVVLFELCAGGRLYANRDGMDGARRVLEEAPPDLAEHRDDVPPALVELLLSMLAKDPALRPPTARRVSRTLEEILSEEIANDGRVETSEVVDSIFGEELERRSAEIATRLDELRTRPRRRSTRSPRPWWAAAAVAVAATLGGVGAWWVIDSGPTPASPTSPQIEPLADSDEGETHAAEAHGAEVHAGEVQNVEVHAAEVQNVEVQRAETASEGRPVAADPPADPEAGPLPPPPVEPAVRRRPRPHRRPASTVESGSGVPTWSWLDQ